MAVAAARQALESSYGSHDRTSQVGLHLHSSMWERGDFYSVACSMHRQLNLPAGMVAEINAMSNSMGLALELAASVLQSRDDVGDALVTAGEQFAEPRFPRLTADFGVVYGDAGAALVLSRAPGIARVRSVATVADTSLEGLNRRTVRDPVDGVAPLDLRSRKRSWFASHGGPEVVVQRSVRAVRRVVGQALADAGIGLLDARWVLLPFFGEKIMREQYLDPLQIPRSRTLVDLGLRFGHLGAADNVVALHHLWSNKMVGLGDSVVLVSSGVGMTWTAAVLEFTRDPISSSSA
ncbi:ketoacyl-ACP synthase III family protein [Labedaea rhizosphaerae]|nr:ketoacyl-ACP synthase III family protein [Labedaea rhizosphaerae]